jgi:heme-degrading monooxygenase HmoA/uncharacterized damage-inducible protein DinB
MITRTWHGRTSLSDADHYFHFLRTKGTDEYRGIPGNISVKVWRKKDNDCCHFYTVTEWNSLEAVKSFAGEQYEKAVYYPEDDNILLEFEETVQHYESEDVSNARIKSYIRQLRQLYEGGSWQQESFLEKLKDIDDASAFREPLPGLNTIAGLVWHCTYWKTVLIERMKGNHGYREATMQQLNFLPPDELHKKGWQRIKDDFEKTHTTLVAMLMPLPDDFLLTEYQPGFTYEHHLEGIVQHDIYHLGQIGLVKRMIKEDKQ